MENLEIINFPKTRPDDFIIELKHINENLASGSSKSSPISFEKGCDTMAIISGAYKSGLHQHPVYIN